MAWMLDTLVHEDSASIEQLAAAIGAAQTDTVETIRAAGAR
jgi:hypothetical protein